MYNTTQLYELSRGLEQEVYRSIDVHLTIGAICILVFLGGIGYGISHIIDEIKRKNESSNGVERFEKG